jgi:dTDP-4-amino-4,6-dideoxygalactose transaminase
MPIPLFAASLEPYMDEITARISEVARSGRYILGPVVEQFEQELADYLGVRHCVGVGNGTDALTIALRAAGVGPGDEVVVPSLTFYATAEAVVNAGATPVFCDVDRLTYCITAETVRPVLTDRTAAIVPVHLFGNVAPVDELRDLGPAVIEDAAQAIGAEHAGIKAGALGDAATFSFFPSKNLGCLGDGGAIATSDDEIAALARRLRFHGSTDKTTFSESGYNSRLDAIQAAVLSILLPHLDGWNAARRDVAAAYERAGLGDFVDLPVTTAEAVPVYHLYIVRHPEADAIADGLAERGVSARGYYRVPVHRQPGMARFGADAELPVTDELAATILALPMGPALASEAAEEVTAAVRDVAGALPVAGAATS